MGPQPLPRNSTSGLFVPSVSGSQDRGRRGAGVRGRIFRGRTPRPIRRQSEARREGDHSSGGGVIARRRVGLVADRGTPAAAGASAPYARSTGRDCSQCLPTAGGRGSGTTPAAFRVSGCSVGSLSDPS
jgi:hypothetical protein